MYCPNCKKEDKVVKHGTRKNKYVTKQQYWCKRCKRSFIEHDGFERMSYPKELYIST